MFAKSLIAATLALALSSAAFAGTYQGGPKSGGWTNASSRSVEVNKPYAQDVSGRGGHVYPGGPKTTIPHGR